MILPTEIKNIIFDYVDTETLLKSRINYNDLSNYFIYKYKKKFSNICIKKSKHLNIVNYLINKNPGLFSFTSFKNSEILVKNEFYNIFIHFLDNKYDGNYITNHCINHCVKNIKLLEYIIEKYGYDGYTNIFTCIDRNYEWKKYSNFINKNMVHFDNDDIKKYLSTPEPYFDIILTGNTEKLKCFEELRNNLVYKSNIEVFSQKNYVDLFYYFTNKTYEKKNIEIHNIINVFITGIEILEKYGLFLSKELFINNIEMLCINYNDCYDYKWFKNDFFEEYKYEVHNIPVSGLKDAKKEVFIYFINKYREYFNQTFEKLFYKFVSNKYYWNIKILIDNGFSLSIDKYKYILDKFVNMIDRKEENIIFDSGVIKDKISVCKYFAYKREDILMYLMIKNGFPYDDELISILVKNNLTTALSYMRKKGLIET